KKVVAYFNSWSIYARGYTPEDLPAEELTHINYAFAKIENGEIALVDPWADVEIQHPGNEDCGQGFAGNINILTNPQGPIRTRNPNIKVLIAIGGWTLSSEFASVASCEESRHRFACSVAHFVRRYNFDGVDIDWEFPVVGGMAGEGPRPQEAWDFVALLQSLRNELDAAGADRCDPYLLTTATSASPNTYRHYRFQEISQCVDFINVMAYDFKGSWSKYTGPHSCLTPAANDPSVSIWTSINEYLAAGVPPHKIVLGIGFYGRGFANVCAGSDNPSGLFVPFQGIPPGTWEEGVFDYRHLRTRHLTNESSFQRFWDEYSKSVSLYDPATRVFITYDDPESIMHKCEHINRFGLGGAMIWEINAD
ncbi:glycoside hydrolase, partial [Dimargaris cristalligena]